MLHFIKKSSNHGLQQIRCNNAIDLSSPINLKAHIFTPYIQRMHLVTKRHPPRNRLQLSSRKRRARVAAAISTLRVFSLSNPERGLRDYFLLRQAARCMLGCVSAMEMQYAQ
jgi:hypothetical protein